jgi:hypothetical protein
MNIKEEIAWVNGLTQIRQDDKERLVRLNRELFGLNQEFCTSCPEQVRNAVKRIKNYGRNEENKR